MRVSRTLVLVEREFLCDQTRMPLRDRTRAVQRGYNVYGRRLPRVHVHIGWNKLLSTKEMRALSRFRNETSDQRIVQLRVQTLSGWYTSLPNQRCLHRREFLVQRYSRLSRRRERLSRNDFADCDFRFGERHRERNHDSRYNIRIVSGSSLSTRLQDGSTAIETKIVQILQRISQEGRGEIFVQTSRQSQRTQKIYAATTGLLVGDSRYRVADTRKRDWMRTICLHAQQATTDSR